MKPHWVGTQQLARASTLGLPRPLWRCNMKQRAQSLRARGLASVLILPGNAQQRRRRKRSVAAPTRRPLISVLHISGLWLAFARSIIRSEAIAEFCRRIRSDQIPF